MEQNSIYDPQAYQEKFCLGQPAHRLQWEEIICRTCGALASGTMLGVNQVEHLLGMGRNGYAYLAMHRSSKQQVALKLSTPDSSTPLWDAARREVRVTTALRHPAILPVFSCSTWTPGKTTSSQDQQMGWQRQQQHYLLTLCQYIPGTFMKFAEYCRKKDTIRAFYDQGTTPARVLIDMLRQPGSALTAAHARGIAHGAIIPGNIFFGNGHAWLADFGLGKLHPPVAPYLPPEFYTIAYAGMSTKSIQDYWHAINPISDQYMFAIVCQQLLNQALTPHELEPLKHPLQRATQQRPDRRYPNIDLFINDLATQAGLHRSGGNWTHPSGVRQLPADTRQLPSGLRQLPSEASSTQAPRSQSDQNRRETDTQSGGKTTFTPVPQQGPSTSNALMPALPVTPITPGLPLGPEDWERRGDKLFTLREYEEALVAYHRAAEIQQNRSQIWLAIGDTYFALERHHEALIAYEQAMYISPNDPQSWINRGATLDALGRHREAIDCYEHAEELR